MPLLFRGYSNTYAEVTFKYDMLYVANLYPYIEQPVIAYWATWGLWGVGSEENREGESWNPGMMTDEEKEKYGIEEIPIEQLKEGVRVLDIHPETLKELIDSGEKTVYYAHNLPIEVRWVGNLEDINSETISHIPVPPSVSPTPTPVETPVTEIMPTPTPTQTPELVKEPEQILNPTVTPTPTPTRVPSSRRNN